MYKMWMLFMYHFLFKPPLLFFSKLDLPHSKVAVLLTKSILYYIIVKIQNVNFIVFSLIKCLLLFFLSIQRNINFGIHLTRYSKPNQPNRKTANRTNPNRNRKKPHIVRM